MESDKEEGGSERKGSDEQQVGKAVKTYECNFCKRGFSNAQALGGHMNIHRKDKAKLKQSQPSSFNTTTINWMSTSFLELHEDLHHHHLHGDTDDHENIVHLRKKLPLFAETPTNCDEIDDDEDKPNVKVPSSTTTIASATQGSSSDLDLELRLGPHPHHPSPTRKFF